MKNAPKNYSDNKQLGKLEGDSDAVINPDVLRVWLFELVTSVEVLRGTVPMEKYVFDLLFNQLVLRGYTTNDARLCEMWCFFGDWTYKGTRPSFTGTDLLLSGEQLKQVIQIVQSRGEYIVMRRGEYRKRIMESHEDGYRVCELRMTKTRHEYDEDSPEKMIIEQQLKIHHLEEKIERMLNSKATE